MEKTVMISVISEGCTKKWFGKIRL